MVAGWWWIGRSVYREGGRLAGWLTARPVGGHGGLVMYLEREGAEGLGYKVNSPSRHHVHYSLRYHVVPCSTRAFFGGGGGGWTDRRPIDANICADVPLRVWGAGVRVGLPCSDVPALHNQRQQSGWLGRVLCYAPLATLWSRERWLPSIDLFSSCMYLSDGHPTVLRYPPLFFFLPLIVDLPNF